ncbi:MAG: isoleucine--tRNA ligase [Saprospiraceae bacterium]|nr:isoleucine--tRNA ligase [Saprospiraceae bacterium]
MYKEYKGLNLPEIDKEILKFWDTEGVFEKSVAQRDPQNSFVFYEGPPSANGQPGIHHVMARTIKDIFCRFQTLNGKRVERKGGWDTHGLPIELAVEKELGITKEDIGKKISVDDYNHKCRETVMRFKDRWDDITVKMGYWVDLDNPYITYENEYIESVWFLLKRLYDKGYLYKGYTIQPYSPAAGTGLSSHELNMPGTYKDVTDTTVVAMFKVKNTEGSSFLFDDENEDVRILAWTTTPWTLPSNLALTVGPNIDYVKIKTKNPYTHADVSVVLAEDLVSKWFGAKNQPHVLEKSAPFKGEILRGISYEQLLNYGNEVQPLNGKTDAFKVITGDFVTTTDGTGIVHTAPSFGADDRRVSIQHGIGDLTLVDKQGKFIDTVGEFSGRYVKNYKDDPEYVDVNVDIAVKLKLEGYAFNVQKYVHPYPHCWRTDKPVLYYPLDSWFIAASKAKDRMYELNQTINWKPAATGEGRFGKWLENLQDWNLSRSRYWGIGLPIWRTRTEGDVFEEKCIGSIVELQAEIDKANAAFGLNQMVPKDMHRPYIDDIVLVSDKGEKMYREPDLIDVWFDSGSMPYAQWGLPPRPPKGGSLPTWSTASSINYAVIKDYAKKHRQNPTMAEAALWEMLRGKKLEGFKFRRQHQIEDFIVDFICLEKRLIIEVDGGYHETEEAKEYDKARTSYLVFNGYKVVRFKNEEVLGDTEGVLRKIHIELAHRPTLTQEDIKNAAHLYPPFGGTKGGIFPADFIAEGVDQTRGWFYTLHAIAVMAYDSVAFKNVVSNGLVQAKDGQKMSKSKGNAVEPFETIAKFGADATRWYMISNAQPWDNLKFDVDGITEVRNKFFGTLYNTYNFFAMYANVDGFVQDEMNQTTIENRTELDRWILSKLHSLVAEVSENYATYEPTQAARAIEKFVDNDFSNWYVRLSRRRFWKGEMSEDKKAAYETMYQCLMVVAQLASPIAPFFTDWLYKNLTDGIRSKAVENDTPLKYPSVHLTDLTQSDSALIDKDLEQQMDYAQRISSLILSLRKKAKIRVRQPLQKAMLPILDANFIHQVEAVKDLILAETNVKTLEYITDTSGVVNKRIRPNLKTLGKVLGKNMRAGQLAIEALTQDEIARIEKEKTHPLSIGDQTYNLTIDDFLITSEDIPGWEVASDGDVTVALDLTLTPELEAEGIARDLVNKIQNIRKEKGLEITDMINVTISVFKDSATLNNFHSENSNLQKRRKRSLEDLIKEDTLALDIKTKEVKQSKVFSKNDDFPVKIGIAKLSNSNKSERQKIIKLVKSDALSLDTDLLLQLAKSADIDKRVKSLSALGTQLYKEPELISNQNVLNAIKANLTHSSSLVRYRAVEAAVKRKKLAKFFKADLVKMKSKENNPAVRKLIEGGLKKLEQKQITFNSKI